MRDLNDCRHFVVHLRLEHRHIHAALREIVTAFAEADEDKDYGKQVARISARIVGLRDNLARHFAAEDEGGCVEEAVSRCPRLHQDAVLLEDQHPKLLNEIDQVIESLPGIRDDESLATARHSFQEFMNELASHEATENRIIQQAFGTGFEED